MADNLIEAAKAFRNTLGSSVLMDQEDAYKVMAAFAEQYAAQRIAARESEIAARLREIHQIGYCVALEEGCDCAMCMYIDELEALRGKGK